MRDRRRVGPRQRSQPCRGDCGWTGAGQLVGASERQRNLPDLASDSPLARRSRVPPGRWEDYLRPSTDVARARFDGRTIFEAAACSREGSTHCLRQAQAAGHSISRLGAERNPAGGAAAHGEKGRFTVGAHSEIGSDDLGRTSVARTAYRCNLVTIDVLAIGSRYRTGQSSFKVLIHHYNRHPLGFFASAKRAKLCDCRFHKRKPAYQTSACNEVESRRGFRPLEASSFHVENSRFVKSHNRPGERKQVVSA
jgi:hypothetical protein